MLILFCRCVADPRFISIQIEVRKSLRSVSSHVLYNFMYSSLTTRLCATRWRQRDDPSYSQHVNGVSRIPPGGQRLLLPIRGEYRKAIFNFKPRKSLIIP